jgi:predicted nucleic acid-binding protein
MNTVLKLFLETSVFNFLVDGKQGQKQRETAKLFAAIKAGKYEAYTSAAVVDELKLAPKAKRDKMAALIEQYITKSFDIDPEAERLADMYIEKQILPLKSRNDGLHIAVAAVMPHK